MANRDGRGWHGDPEGHREAANERDGKTNWWPLLLLPVAFVLGWLGNETVNNANRDVASESRMQPGVGGGPDTTISPSIYPDNEMGQ